jgi:hypothetical protein
VKHFVQTRRPSAGRSREGGYAILLVLFFATLMLLGTMAIAPNILTDARREKEKELVWRGNQYKRGIKMYYRKLSKFPTSLEDLSKPQLGNVRFMRQSYKDPMNNKDGSWRLIYVGPAGQLIGSLKPRRALQLTGAGGFQNIAAVAAPVLGGLAGRQEPVSPFGQSLGQPLGSSNSFGSNQFGASSGSAAPPANTNQLAGAVSTDTSLPGTSADSDAESEALLNEPDPAPVMGGKIIGVGSKINQASYLIYDKAKNYRQFEFIWDPSQDPLVKVGNVGQIGTAPGAQPGQLGQPGALGPGGVNPGTSITNPNNPVSPEPLPPDNAPAPNPPPQY